MDPSFRDYLEMNGIRFQAMNDHTVPLYANHDYMNGLTSLGSGFLGNTSNNDGFNHIPNEPITSNMYSVSSVSNGGTHLHEDYDFSDSVLSYINQILMEEDVEGKSCMLQESLEHQALQDADRSFYEVVGNSFSHEIVPDPSLDYSNLNPCFVCPNVENLNGYWPDSSLGFSNGVNGNVDGNCDSLTLLVNPGCGYEKFELSGSEAEYVVPSYQTSVSPGMSRSGKNVMDGFVGSPISSVQVPDLYYESQSISQFNKGVQEASKFLPSASQLNLGAGTNYLRMKSEGLPKIFEQDESGSLVNLGLDEEEYISSGCRGKKHSFGDGLDKEERNTKQTASYDESDVRSDIFDKVLLYHAGDKNEMVVSLRTSLQTAAAKKAEESGQLKGSGGAKGRGKKLIGRKEVVDLRTLLTNCAQAVAIDDQRTANELLRKIRQHSSTLGDGNQRLAHYMAYGLEARLAGTGSEIYKGLTSKRTSAADVLKAYLLYLAACPFRKLSNFFSNKNIAKRTRRAAKIHIIDFGILYGFQWPTFIQRQSMREGGLPMIKITGIDFPQPGFRPAERVEETGLRLENYAQEFKVPFEYHSIAKRWDAIQLEDFDIDEDEVLIVNCIYRMKNLPDETVSVENSRNNVLRLIRRLNPDLFVHGVVNGSYNAPFFVTRFREALFHFSSQFDMLETIVPCDYDERILIERDLLAREALNVVACEGWERIERPETYKQWQIRNVRAGFTQLPLDSEIKEKARLQVRSGYHKDFVIDEDKRWLLMGWKGRIIYALSTWQPT